MTESENNLEPRTVMSAQRRFGFVALLWWIAAIFGLFSEMQEPSLGRKVFVGISWLLAIFFTFAFVLVLRGRLSKDGSKQ